MLSLMSLRSHHFSGWPQVTAAMVQMRTLQPRGSGVCRGYTAGPEQSQEENSFPPPQATAPSLTALDS